MPEYRAAPTAGAYQTTVQLLRVPLRIDDENQMYFANQTAQNNYFQSVIWKSLPSQTYQRENAYFRVDDDYDAIVTNCNYLRYRNAITGNKWFYAYITEFEYKNPNTTFVHFKIDAYQTYLFDITWKDCFIEREHVTNDSIGFNKLTEDFSAIKDCISHVMINWGELETSANNSIDICPVFILSEWPAPEGGSGPPEYSITNVNGVIQTLYYWTSQYGVDENAGESTVYQDVSTLLEFLRSNTKYDTIVGAFTVPRFSLMNAQNVKLSYGSRTMGAMIYSTGESPVFEQSSNIKYIDLTFEKRDFNGYKPKNNKLYTSQFYNFMLTNYNGETVNLKPEYIPYTVNGDSVEWNLTASVRCGISPDATMYMELFNYGEDSINSHLYTLTLGHFPVPSVKSDYFNSWLAGNSASTNAAITGGALSSLISVAMAFIPGMQVAAAATAVGSVTTVANAVGKAIDASNVPDGIKIATADTSKYMSERQIFAAYIQKINRENCEMIDNYFTMFGYKVNELKVPEFATRQYYNYYKMPVCNITGNIPQTALDEIRAKFQRGITLWNTPDVGNYRNGNNPIVTS